MSDSIDVDALLDSTLDDLEDLPGFQPFPPGVHTAKMSMELKEVNGKVGPEITFTLINTEELADPSTPEEHLCKEGDTCNTFFDLSNKWAQGGFKKIAAVVQAALGTSTNRETIEQCKDLEVLLVTKIRLGKDDEGKKDPDKRYLEVKELQVV